MSEKLVKPHFYIRPPLPGRLITHAPRPRAPVTSSISAAALVERNAIPSPAAPWTTPSDRTTSSSTRPGRGRPFCVSEPRPPLIPQPTPVGIDPRVCPVAASLYIVRHPRIPPRPQYRIWLFSLPARYNCGKYVHKYLFNGRIS